VGTHADQHEPVLLALHHAIDVGRGRGFRQLVVAGAIVAQLGHLYLCRLLDLDFGTVSDEHRLAAPHDGDGLSFLDALDVDLDRGQRLGARIRVHLMDERPQRHRAADTGEADASQGQKVPAIGVLLVRCQGKSPDTMRSSCRMPARARSIWNDSIQHVRRAGRSSAF
jgi:hypothetical protein